jgi:integrase
MKLKLTQEVVDQLAVPTGHKALTWDTDTKGFGVQVTPAGTKTYVIGYRPPGGNYKTHAIAKGSVSLIDARKAAKKKLGQLANGEDPAAAKREAKRERQSRLNTILADGGPYAQAIAKLVNRTWMLNCLLANLPGDRDIASLTRGELVRISNAIAESGRPGAAEYFLKQTKRLLDWAADLELVPANVLAGRRREALTGVDKLAANDNKGHMFADDEIVRLWQATDTLDPFHGVVRFCLLTGVRRREAAKLRRSMIGIRRGKKFIATPLAEAECIVLPAEIMKQRRPHAIPLTPMMRALLDQAPGQDLVFPSVCAGVVIQAWTQRVAKLQADTKLAQPLKLHDCRKTVVSLMHRFGVSDKHSELAIGHKLPGLKGVYDLYEAWPERVAAFKRVSDHISNLVNTQELAQAA